MPTDDLLFQQLRPIVAEILGLEEDEVCPAAHWELDLGGESIDLLDLSFRLEREFGVKFRLPGITSADLTLDERGFLAPDALERLRSQFPLLELQVWETRPFTRPLDLITVGGITAVLRAALAANESASAPAG
jgi:acyl carrier protein